MNRRTLKIGLLAFVLAAIATYFTFNLQRYSSQDYVKARTFYAASQIGMLPGTATYVYSGTVLGKIAAPSDVVSPRFIPTFTVLGMFPLVPKKTVDSIRKRKPA